MKRRNHARLSRSRRLARKLSAYAAVGASLTAAEASAAIIHTDFGRSGRVLVGGLELESFDLDLNADGDAELILSHFFTSHAGDLGRPGDNMAVWIRGVNPANAVLGTLRFISSLSSSRLVPRALRTGDVIATNEPRATIDVVAHYHVSSDPGSFNGEFVDGQAGFLGLLFEIADSGLHTGWAHIQVPTHEQVTIYGYAYETEPGKPILAGDTGVSPHLPGDTDDDDRVDIIDLNNVRNNFGATGDGVLGDTDDDDVVDIEDLNAVRNNFGAGNPVPEPPSLVLLAAGAAGLSGLRRKRMTRRPR